MGSQAPRPRPTHQTADGPVSPPPPPSAPSPTACEIRYSNRTVIEGKIELLADLTRLREAAFQDRGRE